MTKVYVLTWMRLASGGMKITTGVLGVYAKMKDAEDARDVAYGGDWPAPGYGDYPANSHLLAIHPTNLITEPKLQSAFDEYEVKPID